MHTRLFVPLALLAAAPLATSADSWPGFRGPTADGHADGNGVPTQWSEKDNVRWKTPIHGKGHSSPVVLGGQVWVTTSEEVAAGKEPPKKGGPPANPVKAVSLFAVCADLATGKIVHDIKLRTVENPQYCHPFNTYASCTPFVEEGRVYAHFGSLGTFCIDTAGGKVLWERIDLECNHFRGPGSSPVVYGDLVYLIFDGSDVQYVVALEKATGKTKWKTERQIKYGPGPSDGDHKKAYATPALLTVGGKPTLVCPSAECTIGYDPQTGAELWRFAHGGMNGSSRPVLVNGLLYVNSGHSKKLTALKADGLSGAVSPKAVAWTAEKDVSVRASMLVARGLVFMALDEGFATCHDAATGKLVWKERLDKQCTASPVFAGGNVYFCTENGKTFVVKADREYTVVAENRLADGFMASPAVVGDELILRTATHLYAIGKK